MFAALRWTAARIRVACRGTSELKLLLEARNRGKDARCEEPTGDCHRPPVWRPRFARRYARSPRPIACGDPLGGRARTGAARGLARGRPLACARDQHPPRELGALRLTAGGAGARPVSPPLHPCGLAVRRWWLLRYPPRLRCLPASVPHASANRVLYGRGAVSEW